MVKYIRRLSRHFGAPKRIVTDNGTQFAFILTEFDSSLRWLPRMSLVQTIKKSVDDKQLGFGGCDI